MVVLHKAIELAVEKCKKNGFGIVGTYNTFTSTGALAFYGDYIARNGFIGLVFAGSPEMVCSRQARPARFFALLNPLPVPVFAMSAACSPCRPGFFTLWPLSHLLVTLPLVERHDSACACGCLQYAGSWLANAPGFPETL